MSYRSYSSSHGLSDTSRVALRGHWRSSRIAFRGYWLLWFTLALVGGVVPSLPLWAGPETPPGAQSTQGHRKTPPPKEDMTPYLLVFEPTGVRTRSLQGPRMRRPPLLPVHKEATDTASATPAPHQAALPANAHISESVLSSDPLVPPISVAKAPTAPATQEPAAVERVDNAITPAKGQDPELKDAAIYFETPIGARGARVTIPVPAASSPTTHAQPESSASYQQKE